MSNCARGLALAKTCVIEPGHINVSLHVGVGENAPAHPVPGVSVRCDAAADVRVESGTAERIPLNGDNTSVAVLDWGNGFGNPLSLHPKLQADSRSPCV